MKRKGWGGNIEKCFFPIFSSFLFSWFLWRIYLLQWHPHPKLMWPKLITSLWHPRYQNHSGVDSSYSLHISRLFISLPHTSPAMSRFAFPFIWWVWSIFYSNFLQIISLRIEVLILTCQWRVSEEKGKETDCHLREESPRRSVAHRKRPDLLFASSQVWLVSFSCFYSCLSCKILVRLQAYTLDSQCLIWSSIFFHFHSWRSFSNSLRYFQQTPWSKVLLLLFPSFFRSNFLNNCRDMPKESLTSFSGDVGESDKMFLEKLAKLQSLVNYKKVSFFPKLFCYVIKNDSVIF